MYEKLTMHMLLEAQVLAAELDTPARLRTLTLELAL